MKENVANERAAIIAKAGKKAKEAEDKLGPFDEDSFGYLPEDVLCELLDARLKHPECAAGVIFDNLSSKNYASELIGVKIILKTC